MIEREKMEKIEEEILSRYAMKSRESQGRVYPEKEHDYRTAYQRDRDRIVHSTAFRRLEYKTQVFVNHEGDYYRTRLTHTLEVAQIARSIARALMLNESLAESIALAHDLGHTPFGHSGEEALDELMKGYGGFEHNEHGLRVVDFLERRYPDFPGLNLTWEVREGIIKHITCFDQSRISGFPAAEQPTLEAQVVNTSDEIAYDNHDLDDGITSGLIGLEALNEITLWREVRSQIEKQYPGLNEEILKYQIIRALINLEITDLIVESGRRLRDAKISSPPDVRKVKDKLICFSNELAKKREELRGFLIKNLYQHYRVIRMAHKARRFIHDLFEVYLAKPDQLPPTSQNRLKKEETYRVVCDYIAGMTDRYALNEHKKLFDPYERV